MRIAGAVVSGGDMRGVVVGLLGFGFSGASGGGAVEWGDLFDCFITGTRILSWQKFQVLCLGSWASALSVFAELLK